MTRRIKFVVCALWLAALSPGCSNTSPATPTSPLPSRVAIPRLEIVGTRPAERYLDDLAYTVAPGDTAQFQAVLRASDGTARDVTSEARWQSSNYNYMSVIGQGLVTGHMAGVAGISADYEGQHASDKVLVLRPGTYVVGGQVFESREPLTTVDGARLTVVSGSGAGQIGFTSRFQGFRLYGLAGPTTIRVSKGGYRTHEQTVTVATHETLNFDLALLAPRLDLSGSYALTLTAADECGVGLGEGHLPEEARSRRYAAAVTQNGPQLSVELSGAIFIEPMKRDSRIAGQIEPQRVLFDLHWGDANWWWGPPLIAERLETGAGFVVDGSAETVSSRGGLFGTLSGTLFVFAAGVEPAFAATAIAQCGSTKHRFELSR